MSDYSIVPNAALTATADAIRTKSGSQATIEFDHNTGFADAVSAIGGSSYELLAAADIEINTTSTTKTVYHTFQSLTRAWTTEKIVYIRIRDKAGPRAGYYYGADQWFINYQKANNLSSATIFANLQLTFNTDGNWGRVSSVSYGIRAESISDGGDIPISATYSSTGTKTINGIFRCEIYLLDWPDNISPFPKEE